MIHNNNDNNTIKRERNTTTTKNEKKFDKLIEKYHTDKNNIKYIISDNKYGKFSLQSNSKIIEKTTIFSNNEYFLYSMLYVNNKNYFIENAKEIQKFLKKKFDPYSSYDIISMKQRIKSGDQKKSDKYYNDFISNLDSSNVIIDNIYDSDINLSQVDIETNHYCYNYDKYLNLKKQSFGDIERFFEWLSINIFTLLMDKPKKLENKLCSKFKYNNKNDMDTLKYYLINYLIRGYGEKYTSIHEHNIENYPEFIHEDITKDIKLLLDEHLCKLLRKNIHNTIAFISYFDNLNYLNYQQLSNNDDDKNNSKKSQPKYSFISGELISKNTHVIPGYLKENNDEKVNNSLYYNLMNKVVYNELYYLSSPKRKSIERKIFDIRNSKYYNNNSILINYDQLKKLSFKLNRIIVFHSYDMFISNLVKNKVDNNFKYDVKSKLLKINIIDWIGEKFPNLIQNDFAFISNVSINTIINSFILNKKGIYRSKSILPLKIKDFNVNSKARYNIPSNRSKSKYMFNTSAEAKLFYIELNKKMEIVKKKIEVLENKENENEKRKIIQVNNSSECSNNNNDDDISEKNSSTSDSNESNENDTNDNIEYSQPIKKRKITN